MAGKAPIGFSDAGGGSSGKEEGSRDPSDQGSVAQSSPASSSTVGYRRPPTATRFAPGVSGNPRGRPKGARGLSVVIAAALGERVAVTENGRRKRISKLEAAIKQLVNRAAAGETRATQLLLQLVQAQEAKPAPVELSRPAEADLTVMAELARRMGGESS